MTTPAAALLVDALGRVQETVHAAVEGLHETDLAYRVDPEANSIAWLVWHLTRIQDDHLADVAGTDQVWLADAWSDRFGLGLDPADHGYGHTSDQVADVVVPAALLLGYYDAVHERSLDYLGGLDDGELPRIVDRRWDPPVTLAVRLVSVINDCTQHAGQAAFIRGLIDRRR